MKMNQKFNFCYSKFCMQLFSLSGAFVLLLSSCKVAKPSSTYFTNLKRDTTLTGFITNTYESKILKGDKLAIIVSSLSPEEDRFFNGAAASANSTSGATSSVLSTGYAVQDDGTILLHRLGNMQAAGLTRKELAKQIQNKLLAFMKEPIVKVDYIGHKVTIMGEVNNPKVINMEDEQMTLLDAIVLCGDINEKALRNNITIIREEGETKTIKHVNLEDHSIFSSPWYYLKPNDIVLINTDITKVDKQEKRLKLQNNISLASSAISLVVIILSRIIK
jgi:polysaccharide biosynthesis/export protein